MVGYSEMIAALAADYMNVYVVEPSENTGEVVRQEGWTLPFAVRTGEHVAYDKSIQAYVDECLYEKDKESFVEFTKAESLISAFAGGRRRIEVKYRVMRTGGIHYRCVVFIRVSEEGEPLRLVVGFRGTDDVVSAQREMRNEGLNSAYAAISQIYLAMHRVNVKKGTYYAIKTTEAIRRFEDSNSNSFNDNMRTIVKGLAAEQSYVEALEFLDVTTLNERMRNKSHISMSFIGRVAGSCKLHFLKENTDAQGNLEHVIFAMELSDEDAFHSAFDALSRQFLNVFWVNPETDTARIMKLDGYVTKGMDKNSNEAFSYSALLHQYVSDRVHPEDQQMVFDAICSEHLRKVFAAQNEYVGNYRVIRDGEIHNYQYNLVKMEGVDYIIAGFQNIDDIVDQALADERRQQEKEAAYKARLEEQLKIFNSLSRNFRNVYIANVYDSTAKILKLSEDYDAEMITALVGKTFPYDAVISQWIDARVHPNDRERMRKALSTENVQKALAESDEFTGTYRSYERGELRNYQFSISPLDDKGNIIVGFQIIDAIIEEHLAEERKQRAKEEAYQKELMAAKEEADRANSAKTEFLLRMSHDIRTPLNGIMGMLDIAEKFDTDLEKQRECRAKVKESSKVLLELINEVLDMSKLESGEIVLESIPFSLIDVSKDVYGIVAKQAEERDIEIVQDHCNAPHPALIGSPTHYKRLMMNILSNAIKYNKEHGKVYITCKEEKFENGVSTVLFKCRDTGIGMSPEFQKRLFEPFAQEEVSPRSKYAGTGLGMSIAKSIAEKMGGTIAFESEQGVGTTFEVRIPFQVDTSTNAECEVNAKEAKPSIAGLNLLLVEDNDLNMEIAKFLLEEEGANIAQAWNGKEALQTFEQSQPGAFDAVLMDIMMPVMDGYEATRAIRALDREDAKSVPIIAMTANAFAEDRLAAREAGMNDHIAKPLDVGLVVETIAKFAGHKN